MRMTAACVAIAAVTGACQGTPRERASSSVRDSAGIQIVESTAPAWEKGEAWRVDPAPILTIGVLGGLVG